MKKKVLISAKNQHDIIGAVINKLKEIRDIEFIFHDPTKDFLDLEKISDLFNGIDFLIVKVASECSVDLLHYAKTHGIPALHNIDTVLLCKNKVALDHALRKIFHEYMNELNNFKLPKSWTNSAFDIKKFKIWAGDKLPIVIKSHYQHDKYNRFTFLAKNLEEIDFFYEKYKNHLYYNVYVQEFVECDGFDRKIYVIGDKVFGIMRENPIYLFLRERPDSIDINTIERSEFTPDENIQLLAKILSKELNLKIFGFDLIKANKDGALYLIDLNDFPGFRGIKNIENIFIDFIVKYVKEGNY
ncbi:MAG: ATP-grasp domain-containing protein [Promethearchaeia archaeon]